MVLPALIGGAAAIGGNLLGGLLGKESASDARDAAAEQFERQAQLQREFAQSGIRWKVEDAKRAGIHPLYALGASTTSFSPISITNPADNSMANAVSNIGQDVSRAVNQTRTAPERDVAYLTAVRGLQLEKGRVDLDIAKTELASRLARLKQQSGPGLPSPTGNMIPGQGNSPWNTTEAVRQSFSVNEVPFVEPGMITERAFAKSPSGYPPVPSKEMKERIEDDIFQQASFWFRNNLLPTMGLAHQPPRAPSRGKGWWYNPIKQEYQELEEFRPRRLIEGRTKGTYR